MIGADNATLQQRPEILDVVRVDSAAHIFMLLVVNSRVRIEVLQIAVSSILISRDEADLIGDGLFDEQAKSVSAGIFDDLSDHIAFAGDSTNHSDLASMRRTTTPELGAHAGVTVLLLAAYEGLINLYFPRQRKGIATHRRSDPMAHKPRRFVAASAKHPMDLQGAHSFLGMEHQENNLEPFRQLDVGILKNGACQDAKPIAILGAYRDRARALVEAFRAALAHVVEWSRAQLKRFTAASRTFDRAIRPALELKKSLAVFLVRQTGKQFTEGHLMRCHVHTNNIGIL